MNGVTKLSNVVNNTVMDHKVMVIKSMRDDDNDKWGERYREYFYCDLIVMHVIMYGTVDDMPHRNSENFHKQRTTSIKCMKNVSKAYLPSENVMRIY